jgi:hypothetical protein
MTRGAGNRRSLAGRQAGRWLEGADRTVEGLEEPNGTPEQMVRG